MWVFAVGKEFASLILYENTDRYRPLVYFVCALLAACIGPDFYPAADMANPPTFPNSRIYTGGAIQIHRSYPPVSIPSCESDLMPDC